MELAIQELSKIYDDVEVFLFFFLNCCKKVDKETGIVCRYSIVLHKEYLPEKGSMCEEHIYIYRTTF